MKFDVEDIRKITCSAIFFTSALCLTCTVLFASFSRKTSALEELQLARGNVSQLERTLIQSRTDETNIKAYTELALRLDARGIFGREHRLSSVELLESIRSKRKIIALAYEFGPQISLDAGQEKEITFLSTPSHIEISLLHEEDLMHFLDDLRRQARALIRTRSCEIARTTGEELEPVAQRTLRADCQVDWITLRKHSDDRAKK